jgi:MFS transporter, MHS family, proline/betaine transporter
MAVSTDPAVARKAVTAGTVGNFMEWYDFAVYGYMAPIIASLFFPNQVRVVALLSTFAVFAVAFFMRPLGGLVFGHFGDRLGRRGTLAAAVILMAMATFMIGVLPTYAQIGILAPVLLVVARLLQGFSAGGEWGGSASFMVEYAPERRRAFYGSWQQASIAAGLLVGSGLAALITNTLSEDALNAWGWRVPFLIGLVLGIVGLYIRLRIEETPAFRRIEREHEVEAAPLLETFRDYWRAGLIAIGFTLYWTVSYYIFLNYMPTYLSENLDIPLSFALLSNAIGLVLLMVLIPIFGIVSDRIGRKPLLIASAVTMGVLTYPLFMLMGTGNYLLIVLVQLLIAAIIALYSGPGPATVVEMFPTKVRYSGIGVAYNLAVALFGGSAPFIATFLIDRTGNNLAPTYYVIAAAFITLMVLLKLKETYRAPLE